MLRADARAGHAPGRTCWPGWGEFEGALAFLVAEFISPQNCTLSVVWWVLKCTHSATELWALWAEGLRTLGSVDRISRPLSRFL